MAASWTWLLAAGGLLTFWLPAVLSPPTDTMISLLLEEAIQSKAGRAGPEDPMTSYAVVIEQASDGGYGAWSPDLPGCVAVADTEDTVLAEMRQAIKLHLAGLREDGQPFLGPQIEQGEFDARKPASAMLEHHIQPAILPEGGK